MKKTSVSSNNLGTFLSPGALSYSENVSFYNKGWSSERVPHPSTTGFTARRHMSSASALATPFYSGRTLPSKWEDAERWICSPLNSYPPGICKISSTNSHFVEKRRPKSKSGPIVPPPLAPSTSSAIVCYHYSPMAALSSETRAVEAPPVSMRGLMMGSPFSTGVLEADRVFGGNVCGGDAGRDHGWMDLVSESSSSSSNEEKSDDRKEAETAASPVVLRRDMATQMSPDAASSPNQSPSPREREASPLYPSPPLVLSVIEPPIENPYRPEVKEVKVDKRARIIKRSKRRIPRDNKRKLPPAADNVCMNARDTASASSWDISEPAMSISKLQREEAKITAWENLQKAKAEAAVRKLEVKLEKKKSESMDKILNKLQTSRLKAREMRSSISNKQEIQTSKSSNKITHLVRRHSFINSFLSCFPRRADCRTSSSLV